MSILLHRRQQTGITVIATLLILIFIGFVVLLLLKIVPIYMEYFQIRKAVESVKSETSLNTSGAEIQKKLSRRFDIDYITAIEAKDLKVRKGNGRIVVQIRYEDRRPLIGNMDVVAKFDDAIQVAP